MTAEQARDSFMCLVHPLAPWSPWDHASFTLDFYRQLSPFDDGAPEVEAGHAEYLAISVAIYDCFTALGVPDGLQARHRGMVGALLAAVERHYNGG